MTQQEIDRQLKLARAQLASHQAMLTSIGAQFPPAAQVHHATQITHLMAEIARLESAVP